MRLVLIDLRYDDKPQLYWKDANHSFWLLEAKSDCNHMCGILIKAEAALDASILLKLLSFFLVRSLALPAKPLPSQRAGPSKLYY